MLRIEKNSGGPRSPLAALALRLQRSKSPPNFFHLPTALSVFMNLFFIFAIAKHLADNFYRP